MQTPLFAPVIALVLWSFVVGFWLYFARIGAINKYKIVYDPHRPNADFHNQIPRFSLFMAGSIVLLVLTIRAAFVVFTSS